MTRLNYLTFTDGIGNTDVTLIRRLTVKMITRIHTASVYVSMCRKKTRALAMWMAKNGNLSILTVSSISNFVIKQ